jgi:hypothetical protein
MLGQEQVPRNTRQKSVETGKKKVIKKAKKEEKDPSPIDTSLFYYVMYHKDEVSMWNARVFDDGSQHFQEVEFEQFGITDDDLHHAIRLGEKDYFDSARNADPVYYPVSPHIETKLKILNPY